MNSQYAFIGFSVRRFVLALVLFATVPKNVLLAAEGSWWKGNLHTHSLWSDGDDYPEMIAKWYRDNRYHFLALSDHDVVQQGARWINVLSNAGGIDAFERYIEEFGREWIDTKVEEGKYMVRLKPLDEYRHLLEHPNSFLMIPGEEITDRYLTAPIHLNATNLRDLIKPQGGGNVVEVLQNNVNAVLEQRRRTGQPMFPHLNHPNFGWGITAEELMQIEGERFFEVYNGHPAVRNEGDEIHASVERMWDIILTWRLAILNLDPVYGIATDDSHNYHEWGSDQSNSGRGWVMVRASRLTPESIVNAMEAGDFYASSGVEIRDIEVNDRSIQIELTGKPYVTQFIGTRRGFDPANEPVRTANGEKLRITHRYSDDIGEILKEQHGQRPTYEFQGDEIYVRAKVISTRLKKNPYQEGEFEVAWLQPVVPDRKP